MSKYECVGEGVDGDHCCYVAGTVCPHLRENVAGRRFACGLMLEHGSWAKVVKSEGYREIGETWASLSLPFNYCETFDPAFCCKAEYRDGRLNDNAGRDHKAGVELVITRGDLD